jgi:hypothetical protein
MASFQVRRTEGAMPTGKSFFAFPEAMDAGAKAGKGDFWRWTHFSETRHDHLLHKLPGYGRGCLWKSRKVLQLLLTQRAGSR